MVGVITISLDWFFLAVNKVNEGMFCASLRAIFADSYSIRWFKVAAPKAIDRTHIWTDNFFSVLTLPRSCFYDGWPGKDDISYFSMNAWEIRFVKAFLYILWFYNIFQFTFRFLFQLFLKEGTLLLAALVVVSYWTL